MTKPDNSFDNNSLLQIFKKSNNPLAVFFGSELYLKIANDAMLNIWSKDQSTIGQKMIDIFYGLNENFMIQCLTEVWKSRKVHKENNIPFTISINGDHSIIYYDFCFEPILADEDMISCILVTAIKVTELVKTKNLLKEKTIQEQQITDHLTDKNSKLSLSINSLGKATVDQQKSNQTLQKQNIDLKSDNEVYKLNIATLDSTNKDLQNRNQALNDLNTTISELNTKLSESDVSFNNLISQAPVAMMLVKGDDFIVTMINKAMLELIGKNDSIIGKPLFKEMPELTGQPAAEMLIESYEKGVTNSDHSNRVNIIRRGKMEKRYFNFSYTPFIENGVVTGVIDMAVEVTPQVKAIQQRDATIIEKTNLEKTLKKSEQRLQGILETMAEGVGIIDVDGQMVYANPMAQQILGLSESTIKERTYDDPSWQNLRIDGSPLPSEEHPMTIMMATQKPVYDHEIAVQAPGKDRMYISINAAPLFDNEGILTGGIGTFMDVTLRRKISQSKEDFINIASHELKTPVTALKASLQLLERSQEKLSLDSRNKLVAQSIKSLDKLANLITSLLDSSRIEQGLMQLEKKKFTISELFDDCCSDFAQVTNQNIIFRGDISQVVEADSQQIGQVMINFINNAIKYAPESKQITVTAIRTETNEVKISIEDQGPGIPTHKVKYLFERYYRTNHQGQKFTGLGLGLFICADIIKKHGGKVGVETEEGKGSTFWFTLPL